jgi:predicted signal transduction protein with EAL and GGDEF domain
MHAPASGPTATDAATSDPPPPTPLRFALLCLEIDAWLPGRVPCRQHLRPDQQDAVASALTRVVRGDGTVSLLAGGVFACLLSAPPNRAGLSLLAWTLLDATQAIHAGPGAGPPPRLHPCIGIARSPADGASYRALLRNAGAALQRARQQKSGYAFFDAHADIWCVGA